MAPREPTVSSALTPASAPASKFDLAAQRYVAHLQARLAITQPQLGAWERFAASLRANRRRMQAFAQASEAPFGALEDRLAARDAMQRAAAELFAVLDTAQQRIATQVLPLSCWPSACLEAATSGGRPRAASMTDLIAELKRNAAYYNAGPDREAGGLLWRAAKALEQG